MYGWPSVSYSDIKGSWSGEGNINDDPLFVEPDNNDFHLLPDSPCIDTGDPSHPPDPDGTRTDMGAYPFLSNLTLYVYPDTTHYPKTDTLRFTVLLHNYSESYVFLQGWTEVETPYGFFTSPAIVPIISYIGPNQTVSSYIFKNIHDFTPFGGH